MWETVLGFYPELLGCGRCWKSSVGVLPGIQSVGNIICDPTKAQGDCFSFFFFFRLVSYIILFLFAFIHSTANVVHGALALRQCGDGSKHGRLGPCPWRRQTAYVLEKIVDDHWQRPLSWRSGFALSEVTFLSQDLVDKHSESAMKGREKSIPGGEKGRCKGPVVGACLVCFKIKKASKAGAG